MVNKEGRWRVGPYDYLYEPNGVRHRVSFGVAAAIATTANAQLDTIRELRMALQDITENFVKHEEVRTAATVMCGCTWPELMAGIAQDALDHEHASLGGGYKHSHPMAQFSHQHYDPDDSRYIDPDSAHPAPPEQESETLSYCSNCNGEGGDPRQCWKCGKIKHPPASPTTPAEGEHQHNPIDVMGPLTMCAACGAQQLTDGSWKASPPTLAESHEHRWAVRVNGGTVFSSGAFELGCESCHENGMEYITTLQQQLQEAEHVSRIRFERWEQEADRADAAEAQLNAALEASSIAETGRLNAEEKAERYRETLEGISRYVGEPGTATDMALSARAALEEPSRSRS